MKIGLIQIRVSDKPEENLDQLCEGIAACKAQGAELVVLPELWHTPFDNSAIARHAFQAPMLLEAMQQQALRHALWLIGGTLAWPQEKQRFNRCFVIDPKGQIQASVDKLHLLEVHTSKHTYREKDVFTPGDHLGHLPACPWPVGICICYDIRFPEVARLLGERAKVLVVPAGFNAAVGAKHWKPLLQTRAMENELFVLGVNPQKACYPGYTSYGHSLAVDPDGQVLLEMEDNQLWAVVDLDLDRVNKIRERSPFWKLRRKDLYLLEESNEKNSF